MINHWHDLAIFEILLKIFEMLISLLFFKTAVQIHLWRFDLAEQNQAALRRLSNSTDENGAPWSASVKGISISSQIMISNLRKVPVWFLLLCFCFSPHVFYFFISN